MKITVAKILIVTVVYLMLASCTSKPPEHIKEVSVSTEQRAAGYNRRAVTLMNQNRYEAAKIYFEKAIKNFNKTGKHRIEILNCYINLSNCSLELKDTGSSENYLDKAMNIAMQIKDYKDFRLAQSFKELAKSHYMKRNFKAAISNYETVLQIVNRLHGKNHIETARIYNILSQIYFNMGDKQTARIYSDKSLSIKLRGRLKKEPKPSSLEPYTEAYGVVHNKVATIHYKKGLVEFFKGNYDEALQRFHRGISIYLSLDIDNSSAIAGIYLDTAKCYHAKNQLSEAIHYLKLVKDLMKKQKHLAFRRKAEVDYRLGLISMNHSEYSDALRYMQNALQLSSKNFVFKGLLENPDIKYLSTDNIVLNILYTKADILRQLHRQSRDIEYLKSSNRTFHLIVELIYKIRNQDKSSSYRHIFNTRCTPIYNRAIFTALQLYKLTKNSKFLKDALTYTEASKAANLTDMIFETDKTRNSSLPGALKKKERDLYYKLNTFSLYMKKNKASEKGNYSCEEIAKFRKMYYSLLLEHTALVDFLDTQYPNQASYSINISLPDVDKLMKKTGRDSAVLEYYIAGRRVVIYVITDKQIHIHTHKLSYNIKQTVKDFCNSIRKIDEQEYIKLAKQLGNSLITPLEKWIKDRKRLIIIPHGVLFKIPFEALLLNHQGKTDDFRTLDYLIKKYSVTYNYSGSLWSKAGKIDMRRLRFTGFAPVFKGGISLKGYEGQNSNESFCELPGSENEVKGIIDMFRHEGRKAEGFFHNKATEENFIANLSQDPNQIIHIASHSINNKLNPISSGILFNSPQHVDKDRHILYSAEIFNLKLNPALLVLSSCSSGSGSMVENDGLAGINRAFIYSGARNVIFSFWQVDDKSTSEIMLEFYKSILKYGSFTESLRDAKLRMISNDFTSFPKYWSSFVIISGS